MPKIVELRQNRSHIRSNFDGYKLSLEAVPVLRQEPQAAPLRAVPNEDQFSLLHAELFSMQNLLAVDPWARTNSYFVNRLDEVVCSRYDEISGQPQALVVVHRFGGSDGAEGRRKGDYNYSMRFISEKYCVLCDGIQALLLLDTGNRLKASEWREVARTAVGVDVEERNFTIFDCRLDTIQEQKQISVALGRVHRVEAADDIGCSHFMYLHWARWTHKDQVWTFTIADTLEGKGSIYYCAFEPRAESLVISSNRELKYRSQKDAEAAIPLQQVAEKPQLHGESAEIEGVSWSQTDDDVVLHFDIQPDQERTDYSVKSTQGQLSIRCGEETLLDHTLFAKVDSDLTTWTFEKDFLQVTLMKKIPTLFWSSLLADGAGPKESLDNGAPNDLPMDQKPIANLEAPIEDCDFPIGTIEDEIKIDRFHLATKTLTHSVLLGSAPPLFATSLRPGFPLAIATRQDVDACLWLQQFNPSKSEDEWSLRHEGNLHAFGYIQASKQQKKFIECAPDLSYAVICEAQRHIFLYKTRNDSASGLRNRSGPQVTIGKQHLLTLDEGVGEVLGVATGCNVITLLTEHFVLYVQIN